MDNIQLNYNVALFYMNQGLYGKVEHPLMESLRIC